MNIYDAYPDKVSVDGKTYKLNLAYDRVLMALDLQEDNALTPADRLETQCALLVDGYKLGSKSAEEQQRILCAIFDLFPKPDPEEKAGERFIDFHQDAKIIRSAFFRIGVDLLKDKIHFLQFLELLADLPKDTALMRVVDIRAKPIPAPTEHNREYIKALTEAKARVAIRYSEQEAQERFMQALKNSTIGRG